MNFGFILRIAKKDWKEILNNRQFLIPIITMPIVIGVVLPLAFSFIYGSVLVSLVNTVLKPLLLIIPAMLSMIIASDSIAGEKERKTIESLLILPLSDRELIIGKVFSSLFPAFLGSLLAFLSMGLTINITAASLLNGQIVIFTDPTWWILLLLLIPIVAFISTLFMVLISSIAKDVRTAMQYSMFITLPILGVIIIGITQVFILNILGELIFVIIAVLIVIFLAFITTRHLNRERLVRTIS